MSYLRRRDPTPKVAQAIDTRRRNVFVVRVCVEGEVFIVAEYVSHFSLWSRGLA